MSDEKKVAEGYFSEPRPSWQSLLPRKLLSDKPEGVHMPYIETYQRKLRKEDLAAMGSVFTFGMASVVEASRCDACRQTMTPHSSTDWVCQTENCSEKGTPVHTGVYSIQRVRDV